MLDRPWLIVLHLLEGLRQVFEVSHPEVLLLKALYVARVVKDCLCDILVEEGDQFLTRCFLLEEPFELHDSTL